MPAGRDVLQQRHAAIVADAQPVGKTARRLTRLLGVADVRRAAALVSRDGGGNTVLQEPHLPEPPVPDVDAADARMVCRMCGVRLCLAVRGGGIVHPVDRGGAAARQRHTAAHGASRHPRRRGNGARGGQDKIKTSNGRTGSHYCPGNTDSKQMYVRNTFPTALRTYIFINRC